MPNRDGENFKKFTDMVSNQVFSASGIPPEIVRWKQAENNDVNESDIKKGLDKIMEDAKAKAKKKGISVRELLTGARDIPMIQNPNLERVHLDMLEHAFFKFLKRDERTGAIGIDGERPFGCQDVASGILDIIAVDIGDEETEEKQRKYALDLLEKLPDYMRTKYFQREARTETFRT